VKQQSGLSLAYCAASIIGTMAASGFHGRQFSALGSVEIQVMASRKWWISRTVAEHTFWYVSNGSAESRHLQAVMA
jgi:hypothetical protein